MSSSYVSCNNDIEMYGNLQFQSFAEFDTNLSAVYEQWFKPIDVYYVSAWTTTKSPKKNLVLYDCVDRQL